MAVTYVNLNSWVDELIADSSGVGIAAAKQALRATFREFTIDSEAWMRELDPVNIVASQADYTITHPTDATVLSVKAIAHFEDSKFKYYIPQVTQPSFDVPSSVEVAAPTTYQLYIDDMERFTLVPAVNQNITSGMHIWVALTFPDAFDDSKIPLLFKRKWFDSILSGAKSKLYAQQDKPYTNATLAAYNGKRFRNFISRARYEARKQFGHDDAPVPFPLVGVSRNNRGPYGSTTV